MKQLMFFGGAHLSKQLANANCTKIILFCSAETTTQSIRTLQKLAK